MSVCLSVCVSVCVSYFPLRPELPCPRFSALYRVPPLRNPFLVSCCCCCPRHLHASPVPHFILDPSLNPVFLKTLEMKTLWTIDGIEIPDKNSCLHSLVVAYLIHYGYSQTATALTKESALECNFISAKEAENMQIRSKIQEAVMDGHIDEAIEQTNYVAPEVFMSQPSVLFQLKCQKFIEMIRSGDDEATMAFGRAELSEIDAESEEDKQHYREVISLLAYPRPEISPLKHLIQLSRRQSVADSLNQAILISENKPSPSALEMLHKQIVATKELLSQRSPGSASMVRIPCSD